METLAFVSAQSLLLAACKIGVVVSELGPSHHSHSSQVKHPTFISTQGCPWLPHHRLWGTETITHCKWQCPMGYSASLIDGCPLWLLPHEINFSVSTDSFLKAFFSSIHLNSLPVMFPRPEFISSQSDEDRTPWSWMLAGCFSVEKHC